MKYFENLRQAYKDYFDACVRGEIDTDMIDGYVQDNLTKQGLNLEDDSIYTDVLQDEKAILKELSLHLNNIKNEQLYHEVIEVISCDERLAIKDRLREIVSEFHYLDITYIDIKDVVADVIFNKIDGWSSLSIAEILSYIANNEE